MPVEISAAPTAVNDREEKSTQPSTDVSSGQGPPYPDQAQMGLDLGLQAPDAKEPLLEHPSAAVGGQPEPHRLCPSRSRPPTKEGSHPMRLDLMKNFFTSSFTHRIHVDMTS
jgi:hypothetical protein